MKLYVAGPMTGIEGFNFPAFRSSAALLRAAGFEVLDPSRRGSNIPGYEWVDYMRHDIRDVLDVDGIATLPGSHNSRGARIQIRLAEELGIPVRPVADWLAAEVPELLAMLGLLDPTEKP